MLTITNNSDRLPERWVKQKVGKSTIFFSVTIGGPAGLKKLKVLMLTGNPDLEDSEVEKIEDLLPDCNIEY